MRTLRFNVSGQELIRAPGCDFSNIIAGTSGYLQAAFEFGADWDGTVRVAAFYPYPQSEEVAALITDGACIVTLLKSGWLGSVRTARGLPPI